MRSKPQSGAFVRLTLFALVLVVLPFSITAGCGGNGLSSVAPAYRIYFAKYPSIWSILPDGSDLVQLTSPADADAHPAVSSTGDRVLFARQQPGSGDNEDVYVMQADGTGLTQLTTEATEETTPCFSPDGTKIVFESDRTGESKLFVMNADGTGVTSIAGPAGTEDEPQWGASGKIAYTRGNGTTLEIWLCNPDGSGHQKWSTGTGPSLHEQSPHWSPDGTKIAFMRVVLSAPASWSVVIRDVSGPGETTVYSVPYGVVFNPVFTPDGQRVVFRVLDGSTWKLASARTDGSDLTLIPNTDNAGEPAMRR